jgi:hypothetical protein
LVLVALMGNVVLRWSWRDMLVVYILCIIRRLTHRKATHTGIIPAKISFTQPINVTWLPPSSLSSPPIPLGQLTLSDLHSSHARAPISTTTTFHISNQTAFALFSVHLITQSNFTWRLESAGTEVRVGKLPVAKVGFWKEVEMDGEWFLWGECFYEGKADGFFFG